MKAPIWVAKISKCFTANRTLVILYLLIYKYNFWTIELNPLTTISSNNPLFCIHYLSIPNGTPARFAIDHRPEQTRSIRVQRRGNLWNFTMLCPDRVLALALETFSGGQTVPTALFRLPCIAETRRFAQRPRKRSELNLGHQWC